MSSIVDSFNREVDYMRISITDRCDLRCIYCTSYWEDKTHEDILRYEEIHHIVEAAATIGVKKIRITGGEPLLRLGLSHLVYLISHTPGIEEVTLTTNGTHLAKYAEELKAAGLRRVNISLDTFNPEKFKRITGSPCIEDVFAGIAAAHAAGLEPVKINMVVLAGINDDEIVQFARKTVDDGWHVRFIEHMPFKKSETNGMGLVTVDRMKERIESALGPLEPHTSLQGNGPAKYYRLHHAAGTVGFIGALTDCFCERCNRFRLTADGKLRPCLLDDEEVDIKTPLRNGAGIAELAELIKKAATVKKAQHHLGQGTVPSVRTMRQIGG